MTHACSVLPYIPILLELGPLCCQVIHLLLMGLMQLSQFLSIHREFVFHNRLPLTLPIQRLPLPLQPGVGLS